MAVLDQQGIEQHFRKRRKGFVAKVRRNLEEYAEDIVQEAYRRALSAVNSGYEVNNFDAWMNRILFTVSQDFEKFAKGMSMGDGSEEEAQEDVSFAEAVKAELILEASHIENAVERSAVEMNIVYGYNRKEISEILDINIRTVEFWLAKFKNNMKEKYAEG